MSTGREVGWEMISLRYTHKERIEKMKIKLRIMLMSWVCLCFHNKLEFSTKVVCEKGWLIVTLCANNVIERFAKCFPIINEAFLLFACRHWYYRRIWYMKHHEINLCHVRALSLFQRRTAISRHRSDKFNQSTEHSTSEHLIIKLIWIINDGTWKCNYANEISIRCVSKTKRVAFCAC